MYIVFKSIMKCMTQSEWKSKTILWEKWSIHDCIPPFAESLRMWKELFLQSSKGFLKKYRLFHSQLRVNRTIFLHIWHRNTQKAICGILYGTNFMIKQTLCLNLLRIKHNNLRAICTGNNISSSFCASETKL